MDHEKKKRDGSIIVAGIGLVGLLCFLFGTSRGLKLVNGFLSLFDPPKASIWAYPDPGCMELDTYFSQSMNYYRVHPNVNVNEDRDDQCEYPPLSTLMKKQLAPRLEPTQSPEIAKIWGYNWLVTEYLPDTVDARESQWCAFAWPLTPNEPRTTYFTDHAGSIFAWENSPFQGFSSIPFPKDAYAGELFSGGDVKSQWKLLDPAAQFRPK